MSNVLRAARQIIDRLAVPVRMIEIGTAYGEDLGDLCSEHLVRLASIDPMYDWVPDVGPAERFDAAKVSQRKIDRWYENAVAKLHPSTAHFLLVMKSADVPVAHPDHPELVGTDILVVDGFHGAKEAVAADYWDYRRYLSPHHFVLFDDIGLAGPGAALNEIAEELDSKGELVSRSSEGGCVGILEIRSP